MSAHEKRQADAGGLASEFPENPSPCKAQVHNARSAAREALALFPSSAWKASADWHLVLASNARSISAQKYHLRMWAIRWACYMRGIRPGWAEYAPAIFASAIATSRLRTRLRVNDIRRLCREINSIVWGED